ncbi:hypothetical protein B4Q13_25170, partial [Lacticaseibacillus rhamnosus]
MSLGDFDAVTAVLAIPAAAAALLAVLPGYRLPSRPNVPAAVPTLARAPSLLDSIGNGVKMTANGLLIQGVGDGQHVLQELDNLGVGNQRGPLGLQIQQLWTGLSGEPTCHGSKRAWDDRLTQTSMPAWIRHLDLAKHCLHLDTALSCARVA